ncbi:SRPBCC family protein [Phyllobacterium lublinensis]|uniref:SRPBCC family protein n=1 Tax=Phyllobacterium lublinensis TaxID=2875708 RepID=UPI001CCF0E96|nr:SRPBCC domain-containing protein [Phyllobacterium sp. 2063]MBZ9656994.1 SRPBCC domain-containing protein [Phyllobacterium sp. 2063]
MSETAHVTNETAGRVLTIRRLFNAPPALVFDAFTDPKRMLQWMGPRDYPASYVESDLRVGGSWRACLDSAASGEKLWHGGVYQKIVPGRHLAFTFAWDQESGITVGLETLVDITFEAQNDKTLMTFRQSIFDTPENCSSHVQGWNSAFDRLQELLEQD